jgi:IclR family acetate operon transcriptional repressor
MVTHNTTSEPGYQTRALTRALDILDSFVANKQPVSLATLHHSLGLPKSTIVRLAGVLQQHHYLRKREDGYELGPRLLELGWLYLQSHGVFDFVNPVLQRLRDEARETVCFATLVGSDVVHVDVVPSPNPVHFRTDVGSRTHAHSSALGKAILAMLEDSEVREIVGVGPYLRLTGNTLVTWDALEAELATTRTRGYALDDEESVTGLRCIGVAAEAPVMGKVAISISSSPDAIPDERLPQLADLLKRARADLVDVLRQAGGGGVRGSGT